jgi:hypothetical protein
MPTEYRNRVDLDTALKERGMDGFYSRNKKAMEQKELHTFITKKARELGVDWAQRELNSGKMFNKKDIKKV